jgi:hypothetical protein
VIVTWNWKSDERQLSVRICTFAVWTPTVPREAWTSNCRLSLKFNAPESVNPSGAKILPMLNLNGTLWASTGFHWEILTIQGCGGFFPDGS